MNKVTLSKHLPDKTPAVGGIFLDPEDGELFLLASTGNGYMPVSLKNGNRYRAQQATKEEAVKDLQFLGNNLTISVSE